MPLAESQPSRCDLLIVGGPIITLDSQDRIFSHGAIAVTGDTIQAVGESEDIQKRFLPGETIRADNQIVLPGLVNPHNHSPLMLVRGMIEDLSFAPTYTRGVPGIDVLSFDETLALARLGYYELLRAGATTIVDYFRHPRALAQAAEEIGFRAVIGGRIHDADTEALFQGRYEHRPEIGQATLRETIDLIEARRSSTNDRIRIDFAPHAADTCSKSLLGEVSAAVDKHGGNVHTHLAQSRREVDWVRHRDRLAPHEVFADVGLLNHRLIAAHCVFLEPGDVARVGKAGINVAHAPHQNLMAGNIAPIRDLEAAGARIILCTDTRSADLFEAMRLAIASARVRHSEFEPKAPRVLRWAITQGAAALRMERQIGSLEAGKKADLILLDQRCPNLVPIVDGYGIVVHSGHAANVDTVIVGGETLISGGRPVHFDGDNIIREAQQVAARLWRATGAVPLLTA